MVEKTDVVIIGAGPVGLFAIFELGLLNIKCHVIDNLDKVGGQCSELYPDKPIYDIPARNTITGQQLTDELMKQSQPFEPKFHLNQQVESIEKIEKENWIITTSSGTTINTKCIVIAAGAGSFVPRKPPIEGIEKFENIKIKENIKDYGKPFLLFVGSRGRYKNFNYFAEAFSRSEKLYKDFNIICFGGGEFSEDEISLFKRLKIVNSVFKEKNNDDQTLFTLYKKAKCLVYPSTHEGLGLPPIEAMSLGCPTITSNHVAIMEGVGNASAIFDPNNILQIKQVLEKYLYSEDKLKKLIDLGLLQSQKFSWDKCVQETLEVYKKVLD